MKYIETITVKCVVSLLASKTVYFLNEDKLDLFYRKHTLHLILHITIFMHTCTYVFSFYTITALSYCS